MRARLAPSSAPRARRALRRRPSAPRRERAPRAPAAPEERPCASSCAPAACSSAARPGSAARRVVAQLAPAQLRAAPAQVSPAAAGAADVPVARSGAPARADATLSSRAGRAAAARAGGCSRWHRRTSLARSGNWCASSSITASAGQQIAEAVLLERQVRQQQVVVDDDDVGLQRRATREHVAARDLAQRVPRQFSRVEVTAAAADGNRRDPAAPPDRRAAW